jgi:organic radical activating enzyme
MKQLARVITTQDPTLLDVRFWPTDICNFSCNYCFPGSVLNKYRYPKNVNTVIKNFRILFDAYMKLHNKKKFKINIVGGGEPTLWPHLSEFCQGIKETHPVEIQLTSNGSRTLRWWEENSLYVDKVVLSCHYKDVDINNFIQVADYIFGRGTDIGALMLMDATAWDTCVELIEQMRSSKHPWIIQAKEVVDAPGYDIRNYTAEQLSYFKQPFKRVPDTNWIINNIHRFRVHESVSLYDDNSVELALPNYYIVNKLNQWKGWNCNVALENLVITYDGTVTGSCQEPVFSNSNLNMFAEDFEEKFSEESLSLKTLICPRMNCSCQPDTHITKWKS